MKARNQEALIRFTIEELYPLIDPISGKFSEMVEVQLEVAKEEYDGATAANERSVNISIGIIAIAVACALFFGSSLL